MSRIILDIKVTGEFMGLRTKKVAKKISLAAALWLVFLSVAPVIVLAKSLPQDIASGSFAIQLKSAADFGSLLADGYNIRHIIFSDKQAQFQNIYSFDSNENLPELQNHLQNLFVYLEPQRQTQAAGILVNDPGFTTNPQDIDKEWGLSQKPALTRPGKKPPARKITWWRLLIPASTKPTRI